MPLPPHSKLPRPKKHFSDGADKIQSARARMLQGIAVPEARPFRADPFQEQAISSLHAGNDTLVVAPTGTGKTYIAVQAIRNAVEQGKRAVYTAPLKALSNAKYLEFKRAFEPQYRVGLLTSDRKIEGDAEVVVATTEIYRNELFRGAENYALVVLDEFHYLADSQRGPVWEESIILSPRSATLLMLSASISNPGEITEWIEQVRGRAVTVVIENARRVELRLGLLHPEFSVVPLNTTEAWEESMLEELYRSSQPRFGPGRFFRGSGRPAEDDQGARAGRRRRRRHRDQRRRGGN